MVILVATHVSSLLGGDFAPFRRSRTRTPSPLRGGLGWGAARTRLAPMVGEVGPESNLGVGALW